MKITLCLKNVSILRQKLSSNKIRDPRAPYGKSKKSDESRTMYHFCIKISIIITITTVNERQCGFWTEGWSQSSKDLGSNPTCDIYWLCVPLGKSHSLSMHLASTLSLQFADNVLTCIGKGSFPHLGLFTTNKTTSAVHIPSSYE